MEKKLMNNRRFLSALFAFGLVLSAHAQELDKEISGISEKLSKVLVAKSKKKVASVDFVDLQGRPIELGRFLADQLSVEMVNAEGITVVDRANIKSILTEHKLTEEGLVNPENAKKLGQFAGVDAILTGTVTPLDDSVMLTVKAIATETAEVIAAGKASFKKTKEIQELMNKGVASSPSVSSGGGGGSASSQSPSYADADSIATKDIGDLQVMLKSIRPVKSESYDNKMGLQFVFEFVNRNLNEPLLLAVNGGRDDTGRIGARCKVIDSTGDILHARRPNGITLVNVVQNNYPKDPSEIISNIKEGKNAKEFSTDSNDWAGSFTPIEPTKSARATFLCFRAALNRPQQNEKIPDSIQFECELVIGTGDPSQPKNCKLVTLMFDKISLQSIK
jgi:TolB-like protein